MVDGGELRFKPLDVTPIGDAGVVLLREGNPEHLWVKPLAQRSQGRAARAVRAKKNDISPGLAASCPYSPLAALDVAAYGRHPVGLKVCVFSGGEGTGHSASIAANS